MFLRKLIMIKQKNNSKVLDMVEEELLATNKIKDNSKLFKIFMN